MEQAKEKQAKEKKPRHRSPNYPAVGLREAVERVRNLYEKDGKAGAPDNLAAVHIGFATAHGGALAVVAALKKFGLVTPASGRIAPSQRAIEIIMLPENDPRRTQALKDAALEPLIYRELIDQHRKTGFPSNDVIERELVAYKGFNPKAVSAFVKDLMDTLDFAGLSDLAALDLGSDQGADAKMQDQIEQMNKVVSPISSPRPILPRANMASFAVPVEFFSDGQQVVMAHITFDAPIKKQHLAKLRSLLKAMEDELDPGPNS